jgi:DNA-binding response OmpR family regulator/DNA-binding CsgD family transcriptional regulator
VSFRPTVLVVDDDPAMLGLLSETLESAGYNVLVALQGEMALSVIDRITPDAVLLDAMLPGIDGFETCRRIKQRSACALVPVIFMTGLAETSHVVDGLQAGGVDYVTKPVRPDEVAARLKVHLANASLTRSAQAAMDASGRFLLACSRAGQVLWTTQEAARLTGLASGESLPPLLAAWLAGGIAREASEPQAMPFGDSLEFALLGQIGADEFLLRVTRQDQESDITRLREAAPLTPREAEVLLWLARGKSNRDIGAILAVSPRTIDKHLEQIYVKLGVENRAAAVARAVRWLGI